MRVIVGMLNKIFNQNPIKMKKRFKFQIHLKKKFKFLIWKQHFYSFYARMLLLL